ncbi:MAG: hypothetical protein BAJATHORv1_40059 [Candidatus Thorarchaeota archaeon]|nr:MAG: hypothetical protein BAJATHORv1_40059 [Candidatus Thorarchaeota archaeon]
MNIDGGSSGMNRRYQMNLGFELSENMIKVWSGCGQKGPSTTYAVTRQIE